MQVLHAAGVSGLSQEDLFMNAKRLTASPWAQQELFQGLHRVRFLFQPVCLVMLCLQRLVCCHASLVLRQTSTLQALFPANNGFCLDSIVVQDHDRFYLREQPKSQADPESHSQVIPDSEDEAHSLPRSAYTLGSDDISSEHHIATNPHASSCPQTRRKRAKSRAAGRSCSPDNMAAIKANVFHTNTSWQDFPAQQSGSLNAVAAPTSTHQYSVGSRQVTSSVHAGSFDTAALRYEPSKKATAVQRPDGPQTTPAPSSHQRSKARSPSASPGHAASVDTVPAIGSHQCSRAQTSLPVVTAQRFGDTAHLYTPDLPCHSRPEVQQSDAQTDSMHESEQTTGQAEAQTDGNRLPKQQAEASQRNTAGTNVSLYICAALAGACKHASLSLAAQMGFASAYVHFVSQQRSEATAVNIQQKAVVLQDSICATAVDSRQPAAEETLLDTDAAAVGFKQHLAASTTDVLPANSDVALSDGDAQVLDKPEVDVQQAKQNADPSNGQVCYFATSLSSASKWQNAICRWCATSDVVLVTCHLGILCQAQMNNCLHVRQHVAAG